MLKAVGFDFDGILARKIDPTARKRAVNYALKKLKIAEEYTADDRLGGEKYEAFFSRVLSGNDDLALKALKLSDSYYASQGLHTIKEVIPENLETLRILKRNSIPFFVATNNPTNALYFEEFFGDEFIDVPVVAASYDGELLRKPAPDTIVKGFELIGVDPSPDSTLYIGDKIDKDVLASISANTFPVLFFECYKQVQKHIEMAGISVAPQIVNNNSHQFIEITHNDITTKFLAMNTAEKLHSFLLSKMQEV